MDKRNIQGYTLLELIVVIGLMGLLVTVMLINGAESRRIQQLESATRQLESALSQAQAYGNSGRAFPEGSNNPGDFDKGYGVYVTTSSTGDANRKIILYGGLGPGGDGVIDAVEERYSPSSVPTQVFDTQRFEGSVYVKRIENVTSGDIYSEGHALFRRGKVNTGLYGDTTAIPTGLRITLGSGSIEKAVLVYASGLVYVEQ